MKKLFITLIAFLPLTMWAQDNTWELPEMEQEEAAETKENPNQKYLKGAVPLIDGKVVFNTTIEAPGKTAAEIYDILYKMLFLRFILYAAKQSAIYLNDLRHISQKI